MSPTTYELFAVKYAEFDRPALENFVFRDVHDGPMPLDFFVWVAKSPERTFVIDTGFSEAVGARRDRRILRNPREGLAALDIDAARIEDVIVTHMHYDHVGNFEIFPRARFHLQDREMAYATGRHMCHARLRMPFDIENVTGMVREVYRGRVAFHGGDDELASGISLHLVGGHSDGLQFVRVYTRRGWVVLASDAIHFYANVETGNPFPIVFNVGDMMEAGRAAGAWPTARITSCPGTIRWCGRAIRRRPRSSRASRSGSTSRPPSADAPWRTGPRAGASRATPKQLQVAP